MKPGFGNIEAIFRAGSYQAPQNLVAIVVSDTAINLTWSSGKLAKIEKSTNGITYTQIGTGTDSYSDTGLTEYTLYYYRVKVGSYSNVAFERTLSPSILSDGNTVDWIKSYDLSTITKDISYKISRWNDTLASGHDLKQSTTAYSFLWDIDGVLADGINDFMKTDAFTFTQTNGIEIYLLIKLITWEDGDTIFDGDTTNSGRLLQHTATPTIKAFAGSFSDANNDLAVNTWGIIRVLFKGSNSELQVDNNALISGNFGSSDMGGITLGRIGSGVGYFGNFQLKEGIFRKINNTSGNVTKIYNYLNVIKTNFIERITDTFDNSVTYSVGIRSPLSEYSFNTCSTKLLIKANPTLVGVPNYSHITVFENDIYKQKIDFTINDYTEVILSTGFKKVTLVESIDVNPSGTINGTFIENLRIMDYQKLTDNSASKLSIITDSIIEGSGSTIPARDGAGRLFKVNGDINVGFIGYGYGRLYDFAETVEKRNTTIGYLTTLLNGCTTKKLLIAIGTNDNYTDSTPSATWQGWYEALLDAVHTLDATIKIYCLSPLLRNDVAENALMDEYRTAVGTICAARSSYCTHIVGKTILSVGDLADTVHPNTAGHLKLYNALKAVIIDTN